MKVESIFGMRCHLRMNVLLAQVNTTSVCTKRAHETKSAYYVDANSLTIEQKKYIMEMPL
jgi:hypothetical protein